MNYKVTLSTVYNGFDGVLYEGDKQELEEYKLLRTEG